MQPTFPLTSNSVSTANSAIDSPALPTEFSQSIPTNNDLGVLSSIVDEETSDIVSSSIFVVRRDGSSTPLDIAKIRSVVEWACDSQNVNPITLEAGLTTRLRNGVTTREIQDNLIDCALGMCSPNEPAWRYVAGRLHIWSLWKDTQVQRGFGYGDFPAAVQFQVQGESYDRSILKYSMAELAEAGSWINPDWDKDYDYAGAVLLTKRCLLYTSPSPRDGLLSRMPSSA